MSSCEVVVERNPAIITEFADDHLVILRVLVHVMDLVDEHFDSWDHRAILVKSQNKHFESLAHLPVFVEFLNSGGNE